MRPQEATYISEELRKLDPSVLSPCLNLGSSTLDFRVTRKPHIQRNLIAPLERHGIAFVHVDMKEGDGIDIAGDLFEAKTQDRIRGARPRSLFLTNVLEHVPRLTRDSLAQLCVSLIPPGGYIVVSVPRSYPYHADPIDTMFRPDPTAIAALFPTTTMVASAVLPAGTALDDWRAKGPLGMTILRRGAGLLLFPFYRPRTWMHHFHELFWLTRPFRVSVAILQRSSQA